MASNQVSERVATEIRVALARRQVSANQMARDLGYNQSSMARRMSGAVPLTVDELAKVADYLGVPAFTLLSDAESASAQVSA